MLKETFYMAVVYKMTQDGVPVFLLVNSKRSNRLGVTKGHIENGDSEIETDKREIF
jgi:hypothetical protein